MDGIGRTVPYWTEESQRLMDGKSSTKRDWVEGEPRREWRAMRRLSYRTRDDLSAYVLAAQYVEPGGVCSAGRHRAASRWPSFRMRR